MNAYFVIQLPLDKSLTRINDLITLQGARQRLSHQKIHYVFDTDKTKVLLQGEFTDAQIETIKGYAFVTFLGEYKEGAPEQKVRDYVTQNSTTW